MNLGRWRRKQVFIYKKPVDMRKGMDGLAVLVTYEMKLAATDDCIFVFTNRAKDKIKLLIWENNGFWVLYKKLLREHFCWPNWFESDQISLTSDQLNRLLSGYDINQSRPHKSLNLTHLL